jgi:hypothetical protein
MVAVPQTVYARDGDAHLAYQIVADRGPNLLFVPNAPFPIDLLWDEPTVAGHLRRLASFSRLIMTDLLGVGSSDAVPIQDLPAMQAWTDGLIAVLDAAGSECASIFAMAESALRNQAHGKIRQPALVGEGRSTSVCSERSRSRRRSKSSPTPTV